MNRRSVPNPEGEAAGAEATGFGPGTHERLVFFTDAVFAITITLLALEIRLPAGAGELSESGLLDALAAMWPRYLGYIISFLVIGFFWISHCAKFDRIERIDLRLVWLNLLFLLSLGLIPFASSVLSESHGRLGTIIYAGLIVLSALMVQMFWLYARAAKLTTANLTKKEARAAGLPSVIVSAVFALSIPIAFFSPGGAEMTWGLVLAALYVMHFTRPKQNIA